MPCEIFRKYPSDQIRTKTKTCEIVQVVQVNQVVRMISLDDMHSENIYGFYGLNHQIIEKAEMSRL